MRRRILEGVVIADLVLSILIGLFLIFSRGGVTVPPENVAGTVTPTSTPHVSGDQTASQAPDQMTVILAILSALAVFGGPVLAAGIASRSASSSTEKAVRKEIQRVVEVVERQEI